MKYCVPYSKNFKYLVEVDEIIFQYGENHNEELFYNLVSKEDKFKNKRIIIQTVGNYFEEKNSIKRVLELKEHDFNIAIMLPTYHKELDNLIQDLKDNKIDFFFGTWVRDWDTFKGLIELGVSDIYIVENLGFELNLLGRLATEAEVSIRVFANVCQTSWTNGNSMKSFFIRPEDVILYEPYVSVIEFYGQESNIQNVMFRVYAKEKKWFGNLREIIIGLDQDVDSRFLLPIFAVRRISCGKKCVKGGKCNICDRILESEKVLKDKELYIR